MQFWCYFLQISLEFDAVFDTCGLWRRGQWNDAGQSYEITAGNRTNTSKLLIYIVIVILRIHIT